MSSKIIIIKDTLSNEKEVYDSENVLDFLASHFNKWPENARLYHEFVSNEHDITPNSVADIERISKLRGTFFVVIYPGATAVIVAIVIAIVAIIAAVVIAKRASSSIAPNNVDTPSSNNSLSDRTNKARISKRIPDIFGQVRSIPDLIAQPYKFFQENVEIEHCYMCIGRGEYDVVDVREDTTLATEIPGTSIQIYGPYKSPNNSQPDTTIGDPVGIEIGNVKRFSSVNGQILAPPDTFFVEQTNTLTFTRYGSILIDAGASVDFTDLFDAGDSITISGTSFSYYEDETEISGNFNGTYVLSAVSTFALALTTPASVNSNWNYFLDIKDWVNSAGKISNNEEHWTGPFIVDVADATKIICNFYAPNGIYTEDTGKHAFTVNVDVSITMIDDNYNETSDPFTFTAPMRWISSNSQYVNVGTTIECPLIVPGKCKVKVRRTTNKVTASGTVQDVQWRDLYAFSPVSNEHFGDVTTVQSLVRSTPNALEVSERKLNMLATRKIPVRVGSEFTSYNVATKKSSDIICFVCKDVKIGNRSDSEIDFDNIYDTIEEIKGYFGFEESAEFNYTFDDNSMSFEETIVHIADAIHCQAMREGSRLKLKFEKLNNIPTILFNHRNKVPSTEKRTVTFGGQKDYDGVELTWVDPDNNDIETTIYLPEDQSAVNPMQVKTVGIRNYNQAYLLAYRSYNKIIYQNTSIEFEATQEANIATISDKVLVSDGTRLVVNEGEVLEQDVLMLTLSQDVELEDGKQYTIFLQKYDGSIESICVSKTSEANKVLLASAPTFTLVTDSDVYARTTYKITENGDETNMAFLITEKSPQGVMTSTISGINYDARYYKNDFDFKEQQ